MTAQAFKYKTLRRDREHSAELEGVRVSRGEPTDVQIECTACGRVWNYHVLSEGLEYSAVTCPGCGKVEPYAGHV